MNEVSFAQAEFRINQNVNMENIKLENNNNFLAFSWNSNYLNYFLNKNKNKKKLSSKIMCFVFTRQNIDSTFTNAELIQNSRNQTDIDRKFIHFWM